MTETPSPIEEPTGREASVPGAGESRATGFRTWFAVLAVALLALVGIGAYQLGAASAGPPSESGADVGFARDMQTHHNQAVQMAFIIRDKTSDEALRTLAYDIATSQQQQSGQMYGWLVQWGLPQTSSEEPMAWMAGHGSSHGGTEGAVSTQAPGQGASQMPGLASAEEMRALEQATGVEAERQFLTLMIRHHEGGVDMAEAALDLAERREVLGLAKAIVTAQTAEISLLNRLLQTRS